jgi:hypothetical protein
MLLSINDAREYALLGRVFQLAMKPSRYRVGRGEQGVLTVEPYKSQLLPLWRFRTPELARKSAKAIYAKFLDYKGAGDFVGMDMSRKYLQMGWTRARRYANHASGRKYAADGTTILPRVADPEKAKSAAIFYKAYIRAREDAEYKRRKREHQARYG